MFDRPINHQHAEQYNSDRPIPSGDYPVHIVVSEYSISKNSGKEMIKLELEITAGPFARRKLFQYITDDEYADAKAISICESCGVAEPTRIWPGLFQGLRGVVHTKVELYNGEQQAKVSYWKKPEKDQSHPPVDPAMGPDTAAPNADDIPF